MWVVLGLGNPGAEYAGTRHNLGFMVVDALAARAAARLRRAEGDYDAAAASIAGSSVLLAKPRTYVNRSGRAVRQISAQPGFDLSTLLVVVDDVYLPFGRMRLRPDGSAGGHNGLKSIVEQLGGATGFPRLRMGVGAAPAGTALEDWVLGPFEGDERREVAAFVARAADAVERIVADGVDAALPGINAPPP